MNLGNKVKWAEREDKNQNPLDFFRENYNSNITRGQLSREDSGLYIRLWRDGLLEEVRTVKRVIKDPLKYYKQNYEGMMRRELLKEDWGLYYRLWKERLLEEIPVAIRTSKFGEDPLKYYKQNYEGMTRGELRIKDYSLYQTLWKRGLLKKVPLKRRK